MRRSKERRGVLLLVCLVILVLFLLLGVTFVLIASNWRVSSTAHIRAHEYTGPSNLIADDVLMRFLRGTSDPRSPFFVHNLLGDRYGEPSLRGVVDGTNAPAPIAGGQFVRFDIVADGGFSLSSIDHYYDGLEITMLTGTAKGKTSRVVNYDATNATIDVLAFDALPAGGDRFLVNGRSFSGTGGGFNPATGLLQTSPQYAALQGNAMYHNDSDANYPVPGGRGGNNESYDAPTYNDPWLAVVLPGAQTSAHIKPSWHDPQAVAFAGISTGAQFFENYRKMFYRPLGSNIGDPLADHPNFTGGHDKFSPQIDLFTDTNGNGVYDVGETLVFDGNGNGQWDAAGPWDVDNDRDFIPDSIWIDGGLAVETWSDGRLVKPLIAMMVKDLDGRVNINVHGNLGHAVDSYYTGTIAPGVTLAGTATTLNLHPGGLGYGPAEINPVWILGDIDVTADRAIALGQFANLLLGDAATGVQGRYGDDPAGSPAPGAPAADDTLSRLHLVHSFGGLGSFAVQPHDFWGEGITAIDVSGNGTLFNVPTTPILTDEPYEQLLDASGLASVGNDAPFSYADFELLLRATDIDSQSLPTRILELELAPRLANAREMVTPASWDVPVCPAVFPSEVRQDPLVNTHLASGALEMKHFTDLLRARMIIDDNGDTATILNDTVARVNGLIAAGAVSPDLLMGLRFNLNLLFGNGLDDDGDGVVDEPSVVNTPNSEIETEHVYGDTPTFGYPAFDGSPTAFDHNHDGTPNDPVADRFARHNYAKQLYLLLVALADENAHLAVIDPTDTSADAGDDYDLSDADKMKLFRRRIAQFSVNVVDFRDPDLIMTPFEYDENPWNGWDSNADGNLSTAGGADVGVVWGCETPLALITETLAFHNRRVKDLADDLAINGGDYDAGSATNSLHDVASTTDTTSDQYGLPVGSLFLEVNCVAPPSVIGSPELFTAGGLLDLSKLPVPTATEPIWRIVISAPHLDDNEDPIHYAENERYRTTMQPNEMSVLDDNNVGEERFVWFTTTAPASDTDKIFYNRTGDANAQLAPGEYLVVGPRPTTIISQQDDTAGGERQMIVLDSAPFPSVHVTDHTSTYSQSGFAAATNPTNQDYPTIGTHILAPKAVICGSSVPTGWTLVNSPVGLNVSEPLSNSNYYPEAMKAGPLRTALSGLQDVRDYLYAEIAAPTNALARDLPFDGHSGAPANPMPGGRAPTPVFNLNNAGLIAEVTGNGTQINYKTAFLQRLANPLEEHDPTLNPYLTVDWAPIDLTVYNRDEDVSADPNNSYSEPVRLRSRERGRNDGLYNVWAPAAGTIPTYNYNPADSVAVPGSTHPFPYDLVHSLGFLNNSFLSSNNADITPHPRAAALQPYLIDATNRGKPKSPFPWLTWNNRPFVSQYELLQVPASSPGLLTYEYRDAAMTTAANPYEQFDQPFRHLLNFFQSSITYTKPLAGTLDPGTVGAHLGRLFDYVDVPSPYSDSRMIFNPSTFAAPANDVGVFRPPFNVLSRFREPGRININTIFNPRVWAAVLDPNPGSDGVWGTNADDNGNGLTNELGEFGFMNANGFRTTDDICRGPSWDWLVRSRRGYDAGTSSFGKDGVLSPQPTASTWSLFNNPFRAAVDWDLVQGTTSGQEDADATLLRSCNLTGGGTNQEPLFATVFDPGLGVPPPGTAPHIDPNRSYFRYDPLHRLGNLVTTRSNVYAVWITIGYFEVERPDTPDPVKYPDGYRLGREVGEDTGRITRNRAFYIIDRSIPVAYEPGHDHNVRDTIMLRRVIE